MKCPLRAREFATSMSMQECQPDCAWLVDVFKFDGYDDYAGRMCCKVANTLDPSLYEVHPITTTNGGN